MRHKDAWEEITTEDDFHVTIAEAIEKKMRPIIGEGEIEEDYQNGQDLALISYSGVDWRSLEKFFKTPVLKDESPESLKGEAANFLDKYREACKEVVFESYIEEMTYNLNEEVVSRKTAADIARSNNPKELAWGTFLNGKSGKKDLFFYRIPRVELKFIVSGSVEEDFGDEDYNQWDCTVDYEIHFNGEVFKVSGGESHDVKESFKSPDQAALLYLHNLGLKTG